MKNEILEELWKSKDSIAKEYDYDIVKLAKSLMLKEKNEHSKLIDFTNKHRKTIYNS